MKPKTKAKRNKTYEWRGVYLHICGKNLDPGRVSELLHIQPDASGKRGELKGNSKCKQGYWTLAGGPPAWRIETQMKSILERISPVKPQLRKLIRADETVKEAYLTIAFAPPIEIAEACYCFDAELINEFTSMGIDIALSVEIIERWERIFKRSRKKEEDKDRPSSTCSWSNPDTK